MTPQTPHLARSQRWALALLLLAAVAWYRPYEGLRHDGVLYFGQALLKLHPQLRADPFFAGGSQDTWTIYSRLMAPLYAALPVQWTHVPLLLLLWAASGWAVWRLLAGLSSSVRWLGLIALAVLSPYYGGLSVSLAEPFLTGRSFAEPLVLWSGVMLLAGRYKLAALLWGLAAAFHPLLALPAAVVAWLWLALNDRRWLWLSLAVPVAFALGGLGVRPFVGLVSPYDADWWQLVEKINRYAILQHWLLTEWLSVTVDALILLLARRLVPSPELRRLLTAVLLATALLLTFSAVAGDWLHWQLPTQLQTWRVLWIVHVLAVGLGPCVTLAYWARGQACRVLAGVVALLILCADQGWAWGWAFILWALLWWGLLERQVVLSRQMLAAALVATAVCIVGVVIGGALEDFFRFRLGEVLNPEMHAALGVLRQPVLVLALAVAVACAWPERRVPAALALLLVSTMAVVSVLCWDRRPPLTRSIEVGRPAPHPFESALAPGASVYWHDGLAAVWGLLHRPAHFARVQGAGLLFSRNTALLVRERRNAYEELESQRRECETGSLLMKDLPSLRACQQPSLPTLKRLCSRTDGPDFVVLSRSLKLAAVSTWRPEGEAAITFYLYACADLQASEPSLFAK
jgi:hypothetical protein